VRRSHLHLPSRLRWTFYATFTLLFASGLGWWIVHFTTGPEDDASIARTALPWLLKIHGAAAMLSLVVLGVLYPLHIARGLRTDRNRIWGFALVIATTLLIVTGYLLYYASAETLRTVASATHTWTGVGLPLVIALHVIFGRKSR